MKLEYNTRCAWCGRQCEIEGLHRFDHIATKDLIVFICPHCHDGTALSITFLSEGVHIETVTETESK